MRAIILTASTSLVLLIGCKKEGTNYCEGWSSGTVMEPQPYLPLFPGSHWNYLDTANMTVTKSVSATYVQHQIDRGTCKTHIACVPYWDDQYWYGYTYPIYSDHVSIGPTLFAILKDESVGTCWWYESPGHIIERCVVARDTIVEVLGVSYSHVLVIGEGYGIKLAWSYFAKDIGLIRMDCRIGNDTLQMLRLSDYHIGH
ncbi:MAG: hypothetical protein IPP83_01925 [Flavobacteriales bacterium]|nr:hypothetical protein [Flavobacteriales bacterium]